MTAKKPNILIFFTDMQRADTIHALGNDVIKTPNLDRLVNEGVAFTSCYSPSPVCVPARCCLQYGLYPQKTKVFDNAPMMPDNGKSYAGILSQNGYRTHAVGKCHFAPDNRELRGFQSRQIQEECTSDPSRDDYVAWLKDNGYDYYEPQGARGEMYYIPQVSSLPIEAHPSQWVGNESIRFVQEQSSRQEPWCLFSSFIHPHPPFAPPKPWHRLYRGPEMPLPWVPENSADLLMWINRNQNRYKYRDQGIDKNLIRVIKAYCYATISFVDYQIGRVMQSLEESGELDNTLILFSSDHGEYLGDFNCFGKRGMHDASARIPMLARLPSRFAAGQICSTPASLIDIYNTALGAAGIPADRLGVDGTDLAELAQGAAKDRVVYSQFQKGATAIYMAASAEWKYVYSAGDDKEFLFDRRRADGEATNLAGTAQYKVEHGQMKQNVLGYLSSAGAQEAVVNNVGVLDWKKYPHIDEEYLKDPRAKILYQDYPSDNLAAPDYAKTEPRRGFVS